MAIAPTELSSLLDVLEQRGYRLRSLRGDEIEVIDDPRSTLPLALSDTPTDRPPPPSETQQAEQVEQDTDEEVLWLHTGGRPKGLRRPETAPKETPWLDTEKPA